MFWEGWNFFVLANIKKTLEIGDFPDISNLDIGSEIKLKFLPSEEEIRKLENPELERFFESIASHRRGLDCVFVNADFLGRDKFLENLMECTSFLSPEGMMFVYLKNRIDPMNESPMFYLSSYRCRKFNFLGFSRSNAILFPEIHHKNEGRIMPSLPEMSFGVIGKLLKYFQRIKYRSRRVFYFFYFLRALNYFRLSRKFFRHKLFVLVQDNGEQRESFPWFFEKDSHISVLPVKRKSLVPVFSDDGDLKSFCKYSSGKQGEEIISNEVKILKHLAGYEFDTAIVPEVVNYKTNEERFFLEISAQPELKYPKKMGEVHVDWLIELSSKTSTFLPFSESEFFSEIQEKLKVIKFYFKDQAGIWLDELCEEMVAVIHDSNLPFGVVQREFPFYHANIIGDSEKIFVFDWEFGRVNYPPLFDLFHCMLSDKLISGTESVSFPNRVTNTLFVSKHSQVFVKRYIEGLSLSSKIVYPLFILFLIDQLACYLPFVDELEEVKGYLDALQKLKNKSSFSFESWISTVSVQ